MSYSLTLSRTISRRRDQRSNIQEFTKAMRVCPKWRISKMVSPSEPLYESSSDSHTYSYKLYFVKEGKQDEAKMARDWNVLIDAFEKFASANRWSDTPWTVSDVVPEATPLIMEQPAAAEEGATHHGLSSQAVMTIEEVRDLVVPKIDNMLEHESELQSAFGEIFDREPQIRAVLSAIKSFLITGGQRRNHVLLYGLPACAKTQVLLKLKEILGDGAVVRLDATSTTPAGIYKLYFEDLQDAVPPFVIIEEIEKTAEDALRVWLGALDDRGELRKMNFRENRVREVKILCLATANDKTLLDKLMGGTSSRPGALSSRLVNQIFFPRPSREVLKQILLRDIHKYGGSNAWVEPALGLADQLNTNDPRKVLAFLDGAERLLTGEYQDDMLKVVEKELDEQHQDPAFIDVNKLNNIVASHNHANT